MSQQTLPCTPPPPELPRVGSFFSYRCVGNYVAQIVEIQNTTKNNISDEFIVRHLLINTYRDVHSQKVVPQECPAHLAIPFYTNLALPLIYISIIEPNAHSSIISSTVNINTL